MIFNEPTQAPTQTARNVYSSHIAPGFMATAASVATTPSTVNFLGGRNLYSHSGASSELEHSGRQSNPSDHFVRQDNERLRQENSLLGEEIALLRSMQTDMTNQLNNARAQLGTLDTSLQELLYHTSFRSDGGDNDVVARLFRAKESVQAIKRALIFRSEKPAV